MSILNSEKSLRLESFRRPYQKFKKPHDVAARQILVRLLLSNLVGKKPGFRSINFVQSQKTAAIVHPLVLFGPEVLI